MYYILFLSPDGELIKNKEIIVKFFDYPPGLDGNTLLRLTFHRQ